MIIDAHTHILPKEIIRNKDRYIETDATFADLFCVDNCKFSTCEQLIQSMENSGVSKSIIMGMGWTNSDLNRYVNEYLLDASVRYPKQLIPFTGIIPSFLQKDLIEAERCLNEGSKGFGELHATQQNIDITNVKLMEPYMSLLMERGLPITIHCSEPVGHRYPGKGTTTPNILEKFVQNFPNNKIVMAHWGGGLPFFELMPEVKSLFRNVYYDTAATPFLYDHTIFTIGTKAAGSDKILFGSDFPLLSPQKIIRQIDNSDLDLDEKKLVLNKNTLNMLQSDI